MAIDVKVRHVYIGITVNSFGHECWARSANGVNHMHTCRFVTQTGAIIICRHDAFSNPTFLLTMTHERTTFAQQVAQVELWWKVNLNYLSELRHQLIVHARVHALRRSNILTPLRTLYPSAVLFRSSALPTL